MSRVLCILPSYNMPFIEQGQDQYYSRNKAGSQDGISIQQVSKLKENSVTPKREIEGLRYRSNLFPKSSITSDYSRPISPPVGCTHNAQSTSGDSMLCSQGKNVAPPMPLNEDEEMIQFLKERGRKLESLGEYALRMRKKHSRPLLSTSKKRGKVLGVGRCPKAPKTKKQRDEEERMVKRKRFEYEIKHGPNRRLYAPHLDTYYEGEYIEEMLHTL